MKTMKAVLKYQSIILSRTENQKPTALSGIKFKSEESESFKHALDDLVINGMITYIAVNPEILIKRIA